eukprot:20500-Heterococcus_DN1.PRE.2
MLSDASRAHMELYLTGAVPEGHASLLKHGDWWDRVHSLLAEHVMKRSDIAAMQGLLQLRPGAADFMQLCHSLNIPVLVVSAGVTDVIEETLQQHGVLLPNVRVSSNSMLYCDDSKTLKGWVGPVVHSRNKHDSHQRESEYFAQQFAAGRTCALVLGDKRAGTAISNFSVQSSVAVLATCMQQACGTSSTVTALSRVLAAPLLFMRWKNTTSCKLMCPLLTHALSNCCGDLYCSFITHTQPHDAQVADGAPIEAVLTLGFYDAAESRSLVWLLSATCCASWSAKVTERSQCLLTLSVAEYTVTTARALGVSYAREFHDTILAVRRYAYAVLARTKHCNHSGNCSAAKCTLCATAFTLSANNTTYSIALMISTSKSTVIAVFAVATK